MKIAIAILIVFVIVWGINILFAASPIGEIKGTVVNKTDSSITVKVVDGTEQVIAVNDLNVGDNVNITIYKSRFTGKTTYKYFATSYHGVAGE